MDSSTLGAAIGAILGIGSSNAARSEAAASAASDSALEAKGYRDEALAKSYGITVQGTSLMITETTGGGDI